ncbi:serine/threonine/tyrosine-interacting protein-like [Pogonomyrmex barbatus]|uniref:Serine/threonine/tyrosine-interacting protein-like n=1 Tax=Pogonomyrmex barbatus TaxID=144034 RepID=A0A6I9VVU5_9HYME|nr:serine/threonine/tyrosine-interacting protein-like [Pogonomyrmex barbatus]XP_011630996.1 serine/threonine/tyrosine-interacting protein-like [Pogonomyrmex barbatus]
MESSEKGTNESGSDLDCPETSNNWNNLERPYEWTYTMRRNMQEVVPGVFLGPYSAASRSKLQSLLEHRITHIVCVRHAIEANLIRPNFPNHFKYLVLEIADTMTENIIQHFKTVKTFIDEGLNSGGRVLVHGNAGISRSAALVMAYVMETYGYSQSHAFMIVQQKRFCINPNESFMTQLREYEPIYQAKKTLKNDQQNLTSRHSKRKIHQIETDNQTQDKIDTMDS